MLQHTHTQTYTHTGGFFDIYWIKKMFSSYKLWMQVLRYNKFRIKHQNHIQLDTYRTKWNYQISLSWKRQKKLPKHKWKQDLKNLSGMKDMGRVISLLLDFIKGFLLCCETYCNFSQFKLIWYFSLRHNCWKIQL